MFSTYSEDHLDPQANLDNDDERIMVERIAAKHHIQFVDVGENTDNTKKHSEFAEEKHHSENSFFLSIDDPNILKLTHINWLPKKENDATENSSPSISSSSSRSSSDVELDVDLSSDRQLNKLLQWDKEMRMFGVSSMVTIPTPRGVKKEKREKPAFFQTAIVQHCCVKRNCRHQSNSDLPASLRCGGCVSSCLFPCGPVSCKTPGCGPYPCPKPVCLPMPCKPAPCKPRICRPYPCRPCGFKLVLKKRTKFETSPIEITPRSSCIFNKPYAARPCTHHPCCPPPCYNCGQCNGQARLSAPCTAPRRCFHNPPCLPARGPKSVNCSNCDDSKRCDGTAKECGKKCKKMPPSRKTSSMAMLLRSADGASK